MASAPKPKLLLCFILDETSEAMISESFDVEKCFLDNFATESQIVASAPGKDAIFCLPLNKISKRVLDAAGPSLKVVVTSSAGYEHIDLEECKKRNISVGYLGPLIADVMAEFTIGLMIAVGRRFPEAIEDFPHWETKWSPTWLNGYDIMGSIIGIVGFGYIGQAIAKRLQGFSPSKIIYTGPHEKPQAEALNAEYVTLENLLKESDFVIASCAVTDTTRKMFNKDAFKQMKPTSIFINICRGDVVDHEALYEALTNKQIWAAGLDVTTPEPFPCDHPLAKLKNCLILPHMGSASLKLRQKMVMMSYLNLRAGVKGEKMPIRLV